MALHLYELTDQFKQLLEMMENPDIDPEAIADTMEGVQGELEGKVDGTICVIKSLEASAKAIKEEEARLSARRKAMENNATGLKGRRGGARWQGIGPPATESWTPARWGTIALSASITRSAWKRLGRALLTA
jgi:hypothetical protein